MSSAYSNMTQQEMASWQAESMMRERLDESMGNYMPRQRQAPLKKGRNSSYKKTKTSSNLFERLKSKLLSGSNTRTSKRPSKIPSKKTLSMPGNFFFSKFSDIFFILLRKSLDKLIG